MDKVDEIYILFRKEYVKQKKQTILYLNNCEWLSLATKSKAISLLSPSDAMAYKGRETYTQYLYLDNGIHLSADLYKKICKDLKWLEQFIEIRSSSGTNGNVKDYCWIIGIYAACAKYFDSKDKKIAIDASMNAIRLLSGFNAINLYRKIIKSERYNRLERRAISKKGGNSVAELAKIFRMEAIRLLHGFELEKKFWKSRQEAAIAIEPELWQFIEKKRQEGHKTQLKQINLNGAILRWATKNDDLKQAFARVVKKCTVKNKR